MNARRRCTTIAAVLIATWATLASGQQGSAPKSGTVVSQEFCDRFISLGESAQRGFRELRGSAAFGGRSFRTATEALPEATDCVVSEQSSRFMCTWRDRPVYALRQDFDVFAKSISACFPAAKPEEFEIPDSGRKFYDLLIPGGTKGGPSRIAVRLDRQELLLSVEKDSQ